MHLNRRETLAIGLGATALVLMPIRAMAAYEETIMAFTGGAEPADTGITLTAPEIAENGNTVPVAVAAPGAVAITIISTANPNPEVVTFNFGTLAAEQSASTRIRLAGTQDVIAIAKMADGSFAQTSKSVKVTIGGCGG